MLVLVAPGQGAQTPGFLTPWLELPGAADRVAAWSDAIGLDLAHYGTKADADEIRDTAVAQPLLVAAGLLSAAALGDISEIAPGAVAGHSVGEITAAAFAGVLTDTAALPLVRKRGLAMAEAAAVTETGMSALLGGDPEVTVPHLEKLGLTPANVNGAGQIVAAGTLEQLAALAEDKPEGVRKVVALKVAGAFHTHHMAPAVDKLAAAARELAPADPKTAYVSNKDGRVVASGAEVVERLVGQVANPVRWDLCMATFQELGATALLEVCPGGTLTGLAKRALPGVRTLALKTPRRPRRGPRAHRRARLTPAQAPEGADCDMSKIKPSKGAPYARILGVGGYRPTRVVPNEVILETIDSSDEWIRSRSGIETRHWANDEETVAAMSVEASGKAIADAGISAEQIGAVIVSTVTHFRQTPAVATEIADKLGTAKAAAFDISAGCAGFGYGLTLAKGLIVEGSAEYVLVIGVERLSDLTDLEDRATAFLFGDGAGAVVVGPSKVPAIGPTVWGSEGDKSETIRQTVPWTDYRAGRGRAVPRHHAGGPGGLPLGRVRDGEGRSAGAGRGRHQRRRPGRLHSAPGQRADHRLDGEDTQAAGVRHGRP
ncbi:hypothetical protein GCM10020295_58390 [Streptomyces cinereospinus]